ncbi:Glutathione amide reductase [Roseimaritima multifibrata]|uniref:Glutathione amide reductase n=1 Tax=Roseimaritima multifibrata TaxID=1930274 RepID=A0A517MG97_9BACT|nr:NAD(P)/FAD-dependent oxidoreductase [Roseimaritima multifibrata]QDS93910.1 Glutathione amide reductase [Roseimaritima multifibrata]
MSNAEFDLIVIGTGPSASTVATKSREAGKRVAVVEAREFGGACALRGCNPKKVYSNAANLVDRARGAKGKQVEFPAMRIDWQNLLEFKREFTDPVADKTEASYQKRGIETYSGLASFAGPNEIRVGETQLTAKRIFVGVGASPRKLDIPGGQHAMLSDAFFELSSLPNRITFVGGGYISLEFACVAARHGCDVTVIERGDRVLEPFDPDLVAQLVDYSAPHSMKIITDAKVTEISADEVGQSTTVKYYTSKGEKTVLADLVVHGAGRVPNLQNMELNVGEVDFGDRGIKVNDFMQSISNPNVYAAGDCVECPQPRLTPTANEQARVVVKNLFAEQPLNRPDYGDIPQVAFTVPAIAAIGMSQLEAEKGHDVEVRHDDTSSWGSVRKHGQRCAGYKVLVDKKTDRILGAHLLGPGAEETINLFALAMKHGLTATDIKSTLFAFPTFGSDIRRMV